jgi:hypothetical protein
METDIFYYHGKTTDGHRFTIAGRFQTLIENEINSDGADVLMLGISLCGEQDQFAKRLGRIRSAGRMKSKRILGRTYFSLYEETRPLNWFAEKKGKVFVEAAQLNNALSRSSIMRKFNL